MKMTGVLKMVVLAICAFGLAACGSRGEVKPQPTPVAPPPAAAQKSTSEIQRYNVLKGDNLWNISGKKDIYADHFQWPLIFKANRDQIQDPDIIEVGQDLTISREFSSDEVAAAIENAKKTPKYVHHTKPRKHLPIEY